MEAPPSRNRTENASPGQRHESSPQSPPGRRRGGLGPVPALPERLSAFQYAKRKSKICQMEDAPPRPACAEPVELHQHIGTQQEHEGESDPFVGRCRFGPRRAADQQLHGHLDHHELDQRIPQPQDDGFVRMVRKNGEVGHQLQMPEDATHGERGDQLVQEKDLAGAPTDALRRKMRHAQQRQGEADDEEPVRRMHAIADEKGSRKQEIGENPRAPEPHRSREKSPPFSLSPGFLGSVAEEQNAPQPPDHQTRRPEKRFERSSMQSYRAQAPEPDCGAGEDIDRFSGRRHPVAHSTIRAGATRSARHKRDTPPGSLPTGRPMIGPNSTDHCNVGVVQLIHLARSNLYSDGASIFAASPVPSNRNFCT